MNASLEQKTIVCMASGGGSLFLHLIETIRQIKLPIRVAALVTDVADCGAAAHAKKHGIARHVFADWKTEKRAATCEAITHAIEKLHPDLIVSLGFMRILSPEFVQRWQGRLINTHPSLLPAFRGAHAVRDTMKAGTRLAGTSVHEITADVDSGPIIAQSAIYKFDADSENTLHARVKTQEKAQLLHVIMRRLYGNAQDEARS